MNKNVPDRVIKMREAWAKNDAIRDKDNVKPEGVIEYNNIVYTNNEEKSRLDLYMPKEYVGEKLPVVVSTHGGGYFYGSKELYSWYCLDIAKRGFAVVNFDYRLAPEYNFPAPLEDMNSVMVWIEENASKYKLDVERIFMVGDSAGAQLTSHYAAIYSNPDFASLYGMQIPEVYIKGISLACGIYDIRERLDLGDENNIMEDYLGPGFDMSDRRLDIKEHINSNYPATYLFTSENDFLRDYCEPMAHLLIEKGVQAEWKVYGRKECLEINHVFHLDFRYDEGELARKEQVDFFNKLK